MLGATDDVSAQYFSARSGDMTVEVNSTMTTRQSIALAQVIPQYRYTEGIGRRRVLTPDEVLPNDELLIIIRGQKVLRAKKFDFTEHPYAKECVKAHIRDYKPAHPEEKPAPVMVHPQAEETPPPEKKKTAKEKTAGRGASAAKQGEKPAAPAQTSAPPAAAPPEQPSKPAKRPKTLYESARPPTDF